RPAADVGKGVRGCPGGKARQPPKLRGSKQRYSEAPVETASDALDLHASIPRPQPGETRQAWCDRECWRAKRASGRSLLRFACLHTRHKALPKIAPPTLLTRMSRDRSKR